MRHTMEHLRFSVSVNFPNNLIRYEMLWLHFIDKKTEVHTHLRKIPKITKLVSRRS